MTVSTCMPLGAQTFGNKVYCIVLHKNIYDTIFKL